MACSLHVDHELVRAVAMSNAGGNRYSVIDATVSSPIRETKSLTDAVSRVAAIRARRHRPLLGLMLVPSEWAEHFGRDELALFDPCMNLAIGSAVLAELEATCPARAARSCGLEQYERAVGLKDLKAVVLLQLGSLPSTPSPPWFTAPIFVPEPQQSARLLFYDAASYAGDEAK